MHRMIRVAGLALALSSLGCFGWLSGTGPSGSPQLRLTLTGAARVDGLTVLFPGERVAFGSVEGGMTTGYRDVKNGVYRYAAYEFSLNGVSYQQPVIDWVGEEPMDGEAFTYTIAVAPEGPSRLQLTATSRDR